MAVPERQRVHVIAGGYPPGNPASHDHDYARLRILGDLAAHDHVHTTVSGDFEDIEKWLPGTEFLVTYTAGPIPTDEQSTFLGDWIAAGGRWFALHGTSGGRARRVPEALRPDGRPQRRMLRSGYHDVLGGFFLNHPPLRRFEVDVVDRDHAITRGLPASFETIDEPYMVEVAADARVLLTARLGPDNSPPGFGFVYEQDTALLPDGETRVIGYVRDHGKGAVSYVALGHCHTPTTSTQPFVEENVAPGGVTPPTLRGSWDTEAFSLLMRNALAWGLEPR